MRIKITPYAHIEEGRVHMFRTCPKGIESLPAQLHRGIIDISCSIFKNRKGVRMIECSFEIRSFWSLSETIRQTEAVQIGLTWYLKRQKKLK